MAFADTEPGTGGHNMPGDRLMMLAASAAEGFRSLCLAADGGLVDDVGGARCWYSSSYVPIFNGAAMFSEDLFNPETLSAIDLYFAERKRPYSLITLDGLVPAASSKLRQLGYIEIDSSPAMWLNGPLHSRLERPTGLRVSRVGTPSQLIQFRHILGSVFSISASELQLILSERSLDIKEVSHYLGWVGDKPVISASLVLSGPVAGIWNVGTLTDYRRRGLATDMMYRLVSDALAQGFNSSMLLASNDGLPLYRRLGYDTISTVRTFIPIG